MTIDNLEISDWVNQAPSGAVYAALGNVTLRNVYIHDGNMGLITGNNGAFNYAIQKFALCARRWPSRAQPQHLHRRRRLDL
ncbi:MAG: hypothetical protein WBX30_30995 [Stellaceae bacterium]